MAKRSKVDLYGLLDKVVGLYEKGKTIKEIETSLRDEGYDISRESIRRKLKSAKEIASVYKESLDEAKILLEAVKNNPNTDVVEVTNSLLAHKLFEFAKTIDELNFDDPVAFVTAVKRLSDAQVKVAKLRLSFSSGFAAAKDAVMESVAAELSRYPKIKAKLIGIIQNIQAKK